jgi:hypothetical protein
MEGNASTQTATSGGEVLGVLGAGSAPRGLVLNRQTRRALARQRGHRARRRQQAR